MKLTDEESLHTWTHTARHHRVLKLIIVVAALTLVGFRSLAGPELVKSHISSWASTQIDRSVAILATQQTNLPTAPAARCLILQPTGYNNGGYGDFLRLAHRCEVAAQALNCECIRPVVQSAHKYTSSELLTAASPHVQLESSRHCSLGSVLNVTELELNNHNCEPKIIGDPSQCDIFTYYPTRPIYNSDKLSCVANRLRPALIALPPASEERLNACPDGYLAIHKRWGDLASHGKDYRHTTPREVTLGIEHARKLHPHWPKVCFVVFAEGYPHDQVEDVDLPHVVDTNTDLKQVMSDMVHSEILLVGASGLMTPIAMLFEGSELLVVRGIRYRYDGVTRANVTLTALGP